MSQTATSPDAHAPEVWPIGSLKAYERNARKHSPKQIDQLRGSFRKFGQVWPLLIREDGTLIAGHGRLEAARAEGLTEIRVIVARGWSEEQCRAFTILDNKIALNSEWDDKLLGQELAALSNLGVAPDALGFDPKELGSLWPTDGHTGLTEPDAAPLAQPAATVATRGDLWLLGNDQPDWRDAWALFPGAIAYVWHGGLHAGVVERSLQACRFNIRAQIIWVKQRAVISRGAYHWQHEPAWYGVREGEADDWRFIPEHEAASYAVIDGETASWAGGRKQSTVWFIEHMKSGTGHGTQKPVECMKRPIVNNSAPGDCVYEPFSGSGTTIIAAAMSDRSCRALEIDPVYVDVAVRRWQDSTGQKATLDGDGRSFDEIAAERLPKAA